MFERWAHNHTMLIRTDRSRNVINEIIRLERSARITLKRDPVDTEGVLLLPNIERLPGLCCNWHTGRVHLDCPAP